MSIWRQLLFGKYLLVTNTVSSGLMMATGDVIQQRSEHWRKYCSHNFPNSLMAASSSRDEETLATSSTSVYDHDYVRTKNMMIVGLLQGPFHHCFYTILDRVLPGRNAKSVVKKTLLDQSIASPVCLAIFFIGLGILESCKVEELCKELKLKFYETWKVDCCFWPPTQCINFLFVPLHFRVLYTNTMTMFYDIFLSYIKYDAHLE